MCTAHCFGGVDKATAATGDSNAFIWRGAGVPLCEYSVLGLDVRC